MVVQTWRIRESEEEFDPYSSYGDDQTLFSLKIHHSGKFTNYPGRRYVNESINYVDCVDSDEFSVHEINAMFLELGFPPDEEIYYNFRVPGKDLDLGMMPLGNDSDILYFITFVPKYKLIDIYTEHWESRLKTYEICGPSNVIIEEFVEPVPRVLALPWHNVVEFNDQLENAVEDAVVQDTEHAEVSVLEDVVDHAEDNVIDNVQASGVQQDVVMDNVQASVIQQDVDVLEDIATEQESVIDNVQASGVQQDVVMDNVQASVIQEDVVMDNVQASGIQQDVVMDNVQATVSQQDVVMDENPYIPIQQDYESFSVIQEDYQGNQDYFQSFGFSDFNPFLDEVNASLSDEGDGNQGYETNASLSDDEASEEEDSDYIVDDVELQEFEVDMQDFRAFVDMDITEDGLEHDNGDDGLLEDLDLDDFDSLSDEENDTSLQRSLRRLRKRKAKTHGDMEETFYVGQRFTSKEEIKSVVKHHALKTRRNLVLTRNDNGRLRVECVGTNVGLSQKGSGSQHQKDSQSGPIKKDKVVTTCPWILHISNPNKEGSWVVKTYKDKHTCLQTRDVRLCTVGFLSKQIHSIVAVNPSIPLKALQEQLSQKYQIQLSRSKVFRAKSMALERIQGDFASQYGILREYCEELKRANPGTSVRIEVETACNPASDTRQFKRIYICLGPLKAGFKMSGRDLLGLDGCFMKGPFPGQLLTAVGIDANNGIYPVAYALVEAETLNSWTWFLECLGDDLDLGANSNFTFISDRQKGIIPALHKVFPSAEHRYCLRHIHENMKSRWRGNVYKNMLYKCASSTTVPHFESAMKEILTADKGLHDWLRQIPPKHWSRSHFSGRSTSDVLLNNLCEVFNRQLIEGRDKPIITCLEFVREYLMRRTVIVHKIISKCDGPLTPNATMLFEKIKSDASFYTVLWSGSNKYQVNGGTEQYVVNVQEKTCSCRRWELTGMPCRHGVAVIWNMTQHGMDVGIPEDWVSQVYWLETWKKVYANTIDPINGRDMWTPSDCPTKLTPPKHHTQVGRPKKKRKKAADEVKQPVVDGKMARVGSTVTCAKCKQKGHNKRSCKGQVGS